MTTRVAGVFEESVAPVLTSTSMTMPAMDFVVQWSRCGATADYVADYLAYAFDRREIARSVISTVVNELLENAAKYTSDKRAPVRIVARLRGADVELEVENVADEPHVTVLTTLVNALARDEAATLFASRIESDERGGLGLVVLAKDYGARIGAKVVAVKGGAHEPSFRVTVRASIATDEVEQR